MSVSFPEIPDLETIPTGDMPGDQVHINESHLAKVKILFPRLWDLVDRARAENPYGRAVVAVAGGSGVGKSETGSLVAEGFRRLGVSSYVLSGDNYPHRIPSSNDAERRRVYRVAGAKALADHKLFADDARANLPEWQMTDADADPTQVADHPWLAIYHKAGNAALNHYLGSNTETDFEQLSAILTAFKSGADTLTLKRMGRTPEALWYTDVDVRQVQVLVVEWTHGLNANLHGVDVGILLNSTPAETLAHRRARARDGALDSAFTMAVLTLEQAKLHAQAARADIIVSSSGELLSHDQYLVAMGKDLPGAGPLLNVYPDSIGATLSGTVDFLADPLAAGVFESAYLLPSVFNTDLDRGFSVIDYELSKTLASPADLEALRDGGVDLKLDFILNHASVLSPQFQDLLAKGDKSQYADFFIDWNKFWAGHGEMTAEGYIQPDAELIKDMFFRKPGLPILMVRMPDGTEKPYWNTFYQEVRYPRPDAQSLMRAAGLQYGQAQLLAGRIATWLDAGLPAADLDFTGFEAAKVAVMDLLDSERTYLGQMDLNIKSQLVWDFYAATLDKLAGYGAQIVRLDAFAYAPKEPGEKNFLNDPGTWIVLDKVKELASARGLKLLPEIHSRYEEGIHEVISSKGFMTYDFFLPGLLIDALDRTDASVLKKWIGELISKKIRTVNMLGCHDGIPVLDLKGLLDDERIDALIARLKERGGYVKDLHGSKAMYYQVNATYYSALGESDARLLLARAIQLFMPGKPQVWYLDLFAGKNDHDAVTRAGEGGHKEINRSNLSAAQIAEGLTRPIVQDQLALLRFRRTNPAFGFDAECHVAQTADDRLIITWQRNGASATLDADLAATAFTVVATDATGAETFRYSQS